MRILLVTNMWPDEVRPHYGNYIKDQADALRELGVEADILYIRGLISKRAYFTALPIVRRRARDSKYELVHAHYGHTAAVTALAGRRPLVMTFHGEDLLGAPRQTGYTLKSRIEGVAFRQVARLADATITQSREMELALPRQVRRRNEIVPCGIDTGRFSARSRSEARQALGWAAEGQVVLFLGDPEDPRKRVELAERALERIAAQRPDVRLEVAFGHAPDEIPTLLNAADCLVFPSRLEGSPVAVKEAMASELPVVATPVGDIPERFGTTQGCFVRPPLPGPFADAILAALDNGRTPAARLAAVRSPYGAEEPEDLEGIARRLLRVYRNLL